MKRIIAVLILVFMFSVIGCTTEKPSAPTDMEDGEISNNPEGDKPIEDNTQPDTDTETGDKGKQDNTDTSDKGEQDNTDTSDKDEQENAKAEPTVGTKIGDLMKTVQLEALDGSTVSVEDYRGKIVIFNLWATWCPPCKAELPDFDKIAGEYDGDVVVIAAHVPAERNTAYSYVSANFPETKIVFALDTLNADAYISAGGDGYVPYTVILDRSGVIIYSDSGMLSHSQLVAMIENAK